MKANGLAGAAGRISEVGGESVQSYERRDHFAHQYGSGISLADRRATHSALATLIVRLTAPDLGQRIVLINREANGGSGDKLAWGKFQGQ